MAIGDPRFKTAFDYGALYRRFFVVSIILGLLATLVAISTNATSSDLMDQAHVISEVVASYLLPVAFLSMAWLAMRGAPALATIGAALAFLGLTPLAVFAGEDSFYHDVARAGAGPALVAMAQRFNGDGVMNYYNLMFVVGTVLAPVFIGAALWRACDSGMGRHLPDRWAAPGVPLSVRTLPRPHHHPDGGIRGVVRGQHTRSRGAGARKNRAWHDGRLI
jgi:hypothetical protein